MANFGLAELLHQPDEGLKRRAKQRVIVALSAWLLLSCYDDV